MEETVQEPTTGSVVTEDETPAPVETVPAVEAAAPGTATVQSAITYTDTADAPATDAAPPAAEVAATPVAEAAPAAASDTQSDEAAPETPELVAQPATPEVVGLPETLDPTKPIMQQLLDESSKALRVLHHGDVVEGVVAYREPGEIMVDIGAKSEGIIPSKEMMHMSADEMSEVRVGETILVYVVQSENQDGYAVLSLDKAKAEKVWRVLAKNHEANEIIEAPVVGANKGGLLVDLDGVRGFVPSSQVSSLAGLSEANKQMEMGRLNGTLLPLKVIEINRSRNRLILSERQATLERRDAVKDRLMSELEVGQVREGRVTSIADFGAFVDIGGADGLVHLSELSWSRVSRPDEVVRVGERVKVTVLNIDKNSRKVALSLKQTQPEPWSQVLDQYTQGQVVQGTITQIANFGAFARIADGVEGLIHVSELSDNRNLQPRQIVREGDVVNVKIIRIDPQRRRMGLSLKQVVADGFDMFVERVPRPEGTDEVSPDALIGTPDAPEDAAPVNTMPVVETETLVVDEREPVEA